MNTITTTEVAVNRYAPDGSEAINLYATGGAGSLTLGQLIQAVCIRSAAVLEAQSVTKMNTMTAGSVKLDEASGWLSKIADGTANWTEAKSFLVNTMGIETSTLPADLTTYDRRMQAAQALQNKMDLLTRTQQEEMVDLQTLVNRRDLAYNTSSNTTRALGTSSAGNAANLL